MPIVLIKFFVCMSFFSYDFNFWVVVNFISYISYQQHESWQSPPPEKKFQIDHISKTKNHTKRVIQQKMSASSILFYTVNLATFIESLIFGRLKCPFWTAVALKRDMVWWKILHPFFLLAHRASFMSRWPLLRKWGVGGDGYADKINSLRLKKKKMNEEINSLSWEFEIMKQKLMIFEIYWSM